MMQKYDWLLETSIMQIRLFKASLASDFNLFIFRVELLVGKVNITVALKKDLNVLNFPLIFLNSDVNSVKKMHSNAFENLNRIIFKNKILPLF